MKQNFKQQLLLITAAVACLAAPVVAQTVKTAIAEKPKRIVINPSGLPQPFASESVRNPPKVVPAPSNAALNAVGVTVG